MKIYDEPNGVKLIVWKQGDSEMQVYLHPVNGGWLRSGRQMMMNSHGGYDKILKTDFVTKNQAIEWYGVKYEKI